MSLTFKTLINHNKLSLNDVTYNLEFSLSFFLLYGLRFFFCYDKIITCFEITWHRLMIGIPGSDYFFNFLQMFFQFSSLFLIVSFKSSHIFFHLDIEFLSNNWKNHFNLWASKNFDWGSKLSFRTLIQNINLLVFQNAFLNDQNREIVLFVKL